MTDLSETLHRGKIRCSMLHPIPENEKIPQMGLCARQSRRFFATLSFNSLRYFRKGLEKYPNAL